MRAGAELRDDDGDNDHEIRNLGVQLLIQNALDCSPPPPPEASRAEGPEDAGSAASALAQDEGASNIVPDSPAPQLLGATSSSRSLFVRTRL